MTSLKNNKKLAEALKTLRHIHGYTQDYVASDLGVVRQTYSHYETGKRRPDPETIYRLANLYQISVDDLMVLTMDLEQSIYTSETPETRSSRELKSYMDYCLNPNNKKKLQYLSNMEKEMIYYFEKISETDKKEIIEIIKIKANKTTSPNRR